MSILITGGSGLIGASLTQFILGRGERPVLFDIAPIYPILRRIDSDLARKGPNPNGDGRPPIPYPE